MSRTPPHALLLAAPPTGPASWHEVSRRLAHHGWTTEAVDLFDAPGIAAVTAGGTNALLDHLAPRATGAVVVGHGLAVPLAMRLAHRTKVAAVVLSNGPLQHVDALTRLGARAARHVPGLVAAALRPTPLRTLLASSAGMRRLVVNPYVMDHDMVVGITEGWTADVASRRAVARWLSELPREAAYTHAPDAPALLVWADEDILYPAHVADSATAWLPDSVHRRIPGARHLHPIERPWELADIVHEELASTTRSE